jgi:hypothetical protein
MFLLLFQFQANVWRAQGTNSFIGLFEYFCATFVKVLIPINIFLFTVNRILFIEIRLRYSYLFAGRFSLIHDIVGKYHE